jgi:hypothetical protein
MALIGCSSPGVVTTPRASVQLEVALVGPSGDSTGDPVYEEALRAELAKDFGVSAGPGHDKEAARVRVLIEPLDRAQAVGRTISGVVTPFLYDISHSGGNPLGGAMMMEVYLAATVPPFATYAELRSIANNIRLGYKPRHLAVRIEYWSPGCPDPMFKATTDAFEVTGQMRALTLEEAQQPGRLVQEQSRALAVVVARHLRDAGWRTPNGIGG